MLGKPVKGWRQKWGLPERTHPVEEEVGRRESRLGPSGRDRAEQGAAKCSSLSQADSTREAPT